MNFYRTVVPALGLLTALYAGREFITQGPRIGAAAEPVISDSFKQWEQKNWAGDPARAAKLGAKVDHVLDEKTGCGETKGWRPDNADDPRLYTSPEPDTIPVAGAPATHARSLKREGPYLKTVKENWKIFEMTIEYKALDAIAVPPMATDGCTPKNPQPDKNQPDNQNWSNSGVYIFDRYEVQIIDPSKFGIAKGAQVASNDNKSNKNQLLPGGLYAIDPPGGNFRNRANPTGEWNKLVITFCPGKPAKIRTALNPTAEEANIVWSGNIDAAGTGGSRSKLPHAAEGPIFLQSHWGSQVVFRNPFIKELMTCPL